MEKTKKKAKKQQLFSTKYTPEELETIEHCFA